MKLTELKGISDKREADFAKSGVYSVEDLVKLFPKNYLDLRKVEPLEKCYDNDVVLTVGRVLTAPRMFTSARRLKCIRLTAEQGHRGFTVIWFNQPYVANHLKVGEEYLFYGRIKSDFGGATMVNPTFEPVENNVRLKGIIPVYPIKGNLNQKTARDLIRSAVFKLELKSAIPDRLLKQYGLSPLKTAYADVHSPSDMIQARLAAERIAIEEYFALISAFRFIKGDAEQVRINKYSSSAEDLREFTKRFNFEFTDGQKRAVNEIFSDLNGPKPMNRLLQGDVGSGKTAVALCAIYVAVKSGYQVAMLAPTEILAEQNYNAVKRVFPDFPAAFLSGSVKVSEKKKIKESIKNGETKIVVGTHAVLTGDVEFANLALCVCDEQHRFGVAQRSALVSKGSAPDVLVMSATPIPRTVSLVFYGDLDITEIKDKPKSRQIVDTFVVPERKYDGMLGFLQKAIERGEQAFCVCPKIEEDEEGTIMSVTALFEELKNRLPSIRVSLLHGKMKDAEKASVMEDFKGKKADLLVSTTVVEVGIDVPNATVMIIYNAERFGLSQLHQLRGRVGRGDKKSYCFLYTKSDDEKALERLKVVCENSDGFKIAEKDFETRGGGDFMGSRQSGRFMSDLGSLTYPPSAIFTAKKLCDQAFENPSDLTELRKVAMDKYERLKDIAMN